MRYQRSKDQKQKSFIVQFHTVLFIATWTIYLNEKQQKNCHPSDKKDKIAEQTPISSIVQTQAQI